MVIAAFFDLDRTVMSGSSLFPFGRVALHRGFYPRQQLLKDAWHQFLFRRRSSSDQGSDDIRDQVLSFVRGHERAELYLLAPEVVDLCMKHVYPEMLEIIEQYKIDGVQTYLVSASPIEIVGTLASTLGMTGAIGTDAEVDDDGVYTGKLTGPFCYGQGKADGIEILAEREGIDLGESFAYSDSVSDVPMLSVVGHPTCVNADAGLRPIAKEKGWATMRIEPQYGRRIAVGGSVFALVILAGLAAAIVLHNHRSRAGT